MKVILFCRNPYAFGILNPIKKVLQEQKDEFIWYVPQNLLKEFPYKDDLHTITIKDLKDFKSDVIFVPGNDVPHYLRGLKTQIFHGLAGEKKGHFRIRHYFDLYLTQGPYFTNRFLELKSKHKNFDVIQTGWPKLDVFAKNKQQYQQQRKELLDKHQAVNLILYAPTFSPKLTSAPFLIEEIKSLAVNKENLVLIKFHDLMNVMWIEEYKKLAETHNNIIFEEERNVVKFLIMADILISDTSSVIYEFLLLNKPVISFRNISEKIMWDNSVEYNDLTQKVLVNLSEDPFKEQRRYIYEQYHPYSDGLSAARMVESVRKYIVEKGVPEKRKISLFRKYKMYKAFGA